VNVYEYLLPRRIVEKGNGMLLRTRDAGYGL